MALYFLATKQSFRKLNQTQHHEAEEYSRGRRRVNICNSQTLCDIHASTKLTNTKSVMLRVRRPSDRTLLPGLARATDPTSLPRLPHLSQKYLPTRSLNAYLTAPCRRQPAPLHIRRSGHLPPRALKLRCSLLAPARRAPHPCLSLLTPVVPSAAHPPTPSGKPPASIGAGGAIARLRSVPT